jgi:hypothetical protein
MTIIKILDQLQDSYGKPNVMTLFNNNTLFQSPMTPGNYPEMLFYRIKQCQEIQQIRKLPYSEDQIITTAVRILVKSNMFPLKVPTQGVQYVGVNGQQNVPSPQDLLSRNVWTTPYGVGAL